MSRRHAQRGTCPVCLRVYTLVEARALHEHKRTVKSREGNSRERCPGSARQLLDQASLNVGPV
jgi:hypothetical protein